MAQHYIKPERLRQLREQRKMTLKDLSVTSKISVRRLTGLENAGEEPVKVQANTMKQLKGVFRVDDDVLSGTRPIPTYTPSTSTTLDIPSAALLNYELVARKYRIEVKDIALIAPLLFEFAATECLALAKEPQYAEVLDHPEKYHTSDEYPAENAFFDERNAFLAALQTGEIFGRGYVAIMCDEDDDRHPDYPEERSNNWFEDLLQHKIDIHRLHKTARISWCVDTPTAIEGIHSSYPHPLMAIYPHYGHSDTIPNFDVALDQLREITLGHAEAEDALRSGLVRIRDIPDDLWDPLKASERVAWIITRHRQLSDDATGGGTSSDLNLI